MMFTIAVLFIVLHLSLNDYFLSSANMGITHLVPISVPTGNREAFKLVNVQRGRELRRGTPSPLQCVKPQGKGRGPSWEVIWSGSPARETEGVQPTCPPRSRTGSRTQTSGGHLAIQQYSWGSSTQLTLKSLAALSVKPSFAQGYQRKQNTISLK